MAERKYTNEVSVSVFDDGNGVSLNVTPELELGNVRIKTPDKASEEWFGKVDVSLDIAMVPNLIEALRKVMTLNNWD